MAVKPKATKKTLQIIDLDKNLPGFISQTIWFETGGDKSGAYTNDPKDAGGETKWGISKKAHPSLNIKTLTYKEAVEIYKKEYYNPLYSFITDPFLAFKLFDLGVLMGKETSVKQLQKALNDVGAYCKVDGQFGPITSTLVVMFKDKEKLYNAFKFRLKTRATWLTVVRPANLRFIKGWLNRINYNFGE